ncbi:sensor histidine kinase [Streptomyces lasiicapitis]|uniref:histidine kinase n=1 Tax=Streptomyces lasiicapitis TaxID=1923961 RepID=A0ABQ2LKQ2_9ACTN|nr:sensor histidine kinase [Streptomyces lasiicapitis]GGO38551.1 histidine kinase [Streptomyces lasiicapitis]
MSGEAISGDAVSGDAVSGDAVSGEQPAKPLPPGEPADPQVTLWTALRHRPPPRFLLSPLPPRAYCFLLSGAFLGLPVLLVLALLIAAGLLLSVLGAGLVLLTGAALLGVPVARIERRRLRLVEPVVLPDPHRAMRVRDAGVRVWVRIRLRERATWRELGYAVLLGVVFAPAGIGVTLLLALAGILVATPVLVWALAPEPVMVLPGQAIPDPLAAVPFSAAGVVGFVVVAYLAGLLAGAQVKTAWFLLAPREEPLSRRVLELTRSRVRLADAFEAERRRIERDLHDGAQQQLVALTMTLGLAELELGDGSPAAAALLARGRGEARHALEQLRELVRGIHPRVLTDHGVAAAVTEVALRHPVPVAVDIDLPRRLPDAVETTAYFTVTEALANAARHSGASHVTVVGRLERERLRLVITDDGCGGADPDAGTGLSGLADRLAILRGRLVVSSPVGGPTELRVEVPCAA